jgi:Xaa-Pro aminopeptidase
MASLPSPLLYADTERSSDALYFGQVSVPDAFIAFGAKGRKIAVVSALEFGRVSKESDFDQVLPLEKWMDLARATWPRREVGPAEVIALLAKEYQQKKFTIPDDFPARLYRDLRALGVKVEPANGPLFPQREIKTPAEAKALREGNRCSAAGIAAAERTLRQTTIKAGKLLFEGSVLTSERLKLAIETACLGEGSVSFNTIAAGGNQGCDPHHRGSGPLRANELIVVDVFPRVNDTGYHGDMTRTFLRGEASDAQRKLVAAVRDAQKAALKTIRAGVPGRAVHAAAAAVFAQRGFETKSTPEGSVGFFHGTGHGLGLAIHEPPRMNPSADRPLKNGSVVTVEPGLYYPGIGGCRIEDVVQVAATGCKLLSRYGYEWEIR